MLIRKSILLLAALAATTAFGSAGFSSVDTGYTISKVRTAANRGVSYIVASSYEGTLLGISYEGRIGWKNELSGLMNRDLWCKDITGDGSDEILAANSDGTLYCLDSMGKLLWKFKANDAPMNAVSVVRHDGAPYVVCGGYDMNLHYLTAQGELVKTIPSSAYSEEKPWGKAGEKRFPQERCHIANFIRKVRGSDGDEALAVHGALNSNAGTGSIYLFKPMADKPFHAITKLEGSKPYGDFSISDIDGDGVDEITIGSSSMVQDACILRVDLKNDDQRVLRPADFGRKIGGNGYRVAQTVGFGAAGNQQLQNFNAPAHERAPKPVYLLSESLSGDLENWALDLEAKYKSPVFLNGRHMPNVEDWDRSTVGSEQYRQRRDRRKNYTLTQEESLDQILSLYDDHQNGVAFWGGHGNDPYMFSTDTMMKAADGAKGKMSVFIYPELEHDDDDFALVLKEHFYPMAEHFQGKNAHIYVRTKHAFWQSIVYMPLWSRLLSGEFADVFVPSMEETTDKTMEQSVAGRVGLWASGAVNQWGSRGARDNPSFDRLRQHSHQMIPNHFLRAQIYNIACGATYQNNFPVNQEYFSILYELIAKGALYVPDRNEIVSINPVHLSMTQPDKHYLDEGNNAKWLTFYDEQFEQNNPMVFSRLNGTWPGAPVTQWDFSRYAAGVKERRLNFLPPYDYGLVLITPPQHGKFADKDAPRGALTNHLHPIYQNIMKEYITDGRNYLSADGKKTFAADEHYRTVEADIKSAAKRLPLRVSGDVAWVAAQTSPTHLRLTLIDGGYINPNASTATVHFHTVKPINMVDLLSGESFDTSDPSATKVDVPCGLFRFIDIELDRPLEESPKH